MQTSRGKMKALVWPLLLIFPPQSCILFFSLFPPILSITLFCSPNPVVAGELQENIWG